MHAGHLAVCHGLLLEVVHAMKIGSERCPKNGGLSQRKRCSRCSECPSSVFQGSPRAGLEFPFQKNLRVLCALT